MSLQLLNIDREWAKYLGPEMEKDYIRDLSKFLDQERKKKKEIFPQETDIFNAFALTPLSQVKVVILGQDPYHGVGQAHGLAFSVKHGVKIPPSLVNIYKELSSDLGITPPPHGNLEAWAKQGVLLLNSVLTVESGKAGSHHKKGWEQFTDKVIEVLNTRKEKCVFILWGAPAQKKAGFVASDKHFVIKSVHPSPLSSYRGFFGSKPFSQSNSFLKENGISPIDWRIPQP